MAPWQTAPASSLCVLQVYPDMVLCMQFSRTCSVPEQLISDMWIGRVSSPNNWLPTAMAPGITCTCNRTLSHIFQFRMSEELS